MSLTHLFFPLSVFLFSLVARSFPVLCSSFPLLYFWVSSSFLSRSLLFPSGSLHLDLLSSSHSLLRFCFSPSPLLDTVDGFTSHLSRLAPPPIHLTSHLDSSSHTTWAKNRDPTASLLPGCFVSPLHSFDYDCLCIAIVSFTHAPFSSQTKHSLAFVYRFPPRPSPPLHALCHPVQHSRQKPESGFPDLSLLDRQISHPVELQSNLSFFLTGEYCWSF